LRLRANCRSVSGARRDFLACVCLRTG
jgi:hypothetical protein